MSDQRESAGTRRSFEKLVLSRLGLQWRWKVAEESMQKTWFPQTPFWGVFVTLIVIYTLAGAYSPSVLTWMDAILTPLVQALGLVGLGIATPFMDGVMPTQFYVNLTGIAVWGALVYNAASILFLYIHKWTVPNNTELKYRALSNKLSWGPVRIWLTVAIALPISVIYFTVCLLNGINGWFVFHMHGVFVTAFWSVFFLLLPGSLIFTAWFLFTKLAAATLVALIKYISIPFRK